MSESIFLIQDDGSLAELSETPFDAESFLQGLLARYPALLAGPQIDPANPRRWLLIRQEIGLPSEEAGSDRWAVDHLFLDQDAVPTIIEVKRQGDTRIRREVVGQMLDYAANGVVYWNIDALKSQFESRCEKSGEDPESILADFLGPDVEPESFWKQAKTNLQAGRVRLLFVADHIPPELRRIVEFLNEQMDPAEVLAVEVKQFVGDGPRTIVPTVVGQTAQAQQKKSSGRGETRQWDEASFFKAMAEKFGAEEVEGARTILRWCKKHASQVWWGKGKQSGSFTPTFDRSGVHHQVFAIWTGGQVEIHFQHLRNRTPFDDPASREEFLAKLNGIPGVSIPRDGIERRPSIQISVFREPERLEQLLAVFEWCAGRINSA